MKSVISIYEEKIQFMKTIANNDLKFSANGSSQCRLNRRTSRDIDS